MKRRWAWPVTNESDRVPGHAGSRGPNSRSVAGAFDVVLVVTRPDRPRGRSGRPEPSPVKVAADELGLPVSQPENRVALTATIETAGPFEVGVVVAYGMILEARRWLCPVTACSTPTSPSCPGGGVPRPWPGRSSPVTL